MTFHQLAFVDPAFLGVLDPWLAWPLRVALVIGVLGLPLAIYAFATDESAKETARRIRKRRARQLRHFHATALILLLGAGYAYAADVLVDEASHCSAQAWNGAVDNYGWFSACVLWYATGC